MSADTKRQSTLNRVPIALPKSDGSPAAAGPASNSIVSQDVSLHQCIGARASITLTGQSVVEGIIYTADPITNLVVVITSPTSSTGTNDASSSSSSSSSSTAASASFTITASNPTAPAGSYRLIPISQITNFELLTLPNRTNTPPAPAATAATSTTLDTAALESRLASAVAQAQKAQLRLGPRGTSVLDQLVFDALSRTQPARWEGTRMVIADVYVIDRPYERDNVRMLPGAAGDLNRMKKVLEMERKKAQLKLPLPAPAAAVAAPPPPPSTDSTPSASGTWAKPGPGQAQAQKKGG